MHTDRQISYLTQCDTGGALCNYAPTKPCPNTARLSKPGKWRCPDCEAKHGKL